MAEPTDNHSTNGARIKQKPKRASEPELWTVKEAAELLRTAPRTIDN